MKVEFLSSQVSAEADLYVVGVYQGSSEGPFEGELSTIDERLSNAITSLLKSEEITGKANEVTLLHTFGKLAAKKVLVLGLGELDKYDEQAVRKSAATIVKTARKEKLAKVASPIFKGANDQVSYGFAKAFAEGIHLANYEFEGYNSKREESTCLDAFYITGLDSDEASRGLDAGHAYAEGTNLARQLVNTPGNLLTPTDFANQALEVAKRHGFESEILDVEDMKRFGMGGLLAVASGSQQPPKMIVLKYQGKSEWTDVLGLVGKGITFDTGGISIKPAADMDLMKTDMGGGAAVLGAMETIGRLKPAVNVVAVIPATENMSGGAAYKPGDVITTMSGKTIEVLNTDAEGRIVLADGVFYAKHLGANRIIDLATLTGAVVIALGDVTTGAMTNNDEFLSEFLACAGTTGEKVWQLPTFDEYKEQIKSSVADVANIGGRGAGSITAGLFIGTFVEDTPWIHLDIAGTAYLKKETDLGPKGATGVMVRTLVEFTTQQAE